MLNCRSCVEYQYWNSVPEPNTSAKKLALGFCEIRLGVQVLEGRVPVLEVAYWYSIDDLKIQRSD